MAMSVAVPANNNSHRESSTWAGEGSIMSVPSSKKHNTWTHATSSFKMPAINRGTTNAELRDSAMGLQLVPHTSCAWTLHVTCTLFWQVGLKRGHRARSIARPAKISSSVLLKLSHRRAEPGTLYVRRTCYVLRLHREEKHIGTVKLMDHLGQKPIYSYLYSKCIF
jgi:hypothetical protein